MRPCSVCVTGKVEIDEAIVRGEPLSAIARRTKLGRESLRRHKGHLLVRRKERLELDRRAVASGRPPVDPVATLFSKIAKYEARLTAVLRRAERKGRNSDAIAALRELSRLAELGARGSAALQPPEQKETDVGKMIAQAAMRVREEREREWEFVRGKGAAELLRDALRIVESGSGGEANDLDAARFRVAKAAESLESEASARVWAYQLAAPTVEPESIPDAEVIAESGPAAENIVAFRPPDEKSKPRDPDESGGKHSAGHRRCSPFWCAAAMVAAQDGDERESIGDEWKKSGF